jgi:hypothetical protein
MQTFDKKAILTLVFAGVACLPACTRNSAFRR